jgi:RNA polymerase sigma-70 factor (ECF subfamily)
VLPLEKPDPRTTSVIAGTRLDLLDAMEIIERDHPQFVEPLILRDVYGMSYDDIAQLVGAPLGTVKAQIHHGRKLARPLLRGSE